MSLLRFEMPDMTQGIDLTGQQNGQKRDVADPNANVNERVLAGANIEDILATGVDIDRNDLAREEYFDNALNSVNLRMTDIDLINMQQQRVAKEGVATDLLKVGSTTGGKLGLSDRLEVTTDQLLQARNGSKEVALSTLHREDGWHTYDQDNEHGIWQVGHHHDNDGIYSDFRATINGLAVSMSLQGVDWNDLNQALGPMGNLDQMRDALDGLNNIATSRAGLAGFGAFFQALDQDLFNRQKVENPKATDLRAPLGTPEEEIKTPQMAYRPPEKQLDGPGGNGPGMSMGSPNMRV